MKIISVKYLDILRVWLKTAMNLPKALSLVLKNLVSMIVGWSKSKIRERFEKNSENLVNFVITIPVLVLTFFIPYTFMLSTKERTIIGIILQILAGAILIFDQISSNMRIRKQVTKIIQKPTLFALLITIILLPFAISIWAGLSDVGSDRWSTAGGITVFIIITYGMFLSSLTFLSKIKWLRSGNYMPATGDKFDISNLSLRNVGILLGISLILALLLGYLLQRFSLNKELWIQIPLFAFTFFYLLTGFPLLIISPLYFLAFIFVEFNRYIRKKKKLGAWFWIFLFILWTWGGLLLIMKEFK